MNLEQRSAAIHRRGPAYTGFPDARGHYGPYGGRYVAETLMPALLELEEAYRKTVALPEFQAELSGLLKDYAGRPTPLFHARRLSERTGGAAIYLKREDLAHTGAHKINNTLGQVLLARWMGKRKVIAETGRASTEWPPPPPRPCSGWSAGSSWAPKTCGARLRMCSGWNCSVRKWSPWHPAPAL